METKFLFTQLLAILGAVLYFLSYQCKDNCKLYAMQFLSYLFYIAHFIILGALTGGRSYVLNLARSLFLASKWEFARSNKMCVILCSMQGIVAVSYTHLMVEAYWNIGKSIVEQKDGYKKQNMAADYFQIVT